MQVQMQMRLLLSRNFLGRVVSGMYGLWELAIPTHFPFFPRVAAGLLGPREMECLRGSMTARG